MVEGDWRNVNIGRRLHRAVDAFDARVLELMRARGFVELSVSQLSVTRNLDKNGNRLSELADRARMSRASIGELVTQVEKAGIVIRQSDPIDGRARIVRFTEEGELWLHGFRACIEKAEAEFRQVVGESEACSIHASLTCYILEAVKKQG